MLDAQRAGRGTVRKSEILTVAPHKLQSSKGNLESSLDSLRGAFAFLASNLVEAETAFDPGSWVRWSWVLLGPKEYPFLSDWAECSSQSWTFKRQLDSHPQRLISFCACQNEDTLIENNHVTE